MATGAAFKTWKTRWTDFVTLSGLTAQPKAVQLAMLRSCLSDDTVHIVENMGLSRSAPTVAVDVFGTRRGKLRALPDTGADISLAGPEFAETFGRGRMTPSTVRPMVVDGRSCDSIGKVEVTIRMGDIEVNEQVHIIPGVKRLILSWKTTQRLGIIPEDYPEQKWNIPQDITAAVSARRTITRPAERQTAALGPPVERQTAALGPLSERQTAAFGPPVERQTAALGPPVERQTAALGPPVERQTAALGSPVERQTAALGLLSERQTAALGAPAEQRAARTGAPGPAEQRAARGAAFKTWKTRWTDFVTLSGLTAQPKAVQLAMLRSCLSDDTVHIVENMGLSRVSAIEKER
ncbi:Snake venom metalloprotease inhibitor 02A10 [Amphibalanus amphitrite]|uniref:Snake venom metalloprotease inhibitor 02A10 n=1 Tax=Amphibalanus amphitrite TaxID=1232801 RepID=A0A6A4W4I4_AMPAM|nr:Snake venom metalloprotease inhibitor 02A10 [Amphibalanus amphitrite]